MTKKISLSAFLVVRNEAHNVKRALRSLNFCDEIIIVDQESTDKTVDICRRYTKRIFNDRHWGYCEPSRVVGASKCRGRWILNLDADEEVSVDLKKDILKAIRENNMSAFKIHRNFFYFGRLMKHLCKDEYILRFHRKDAVTYTSNIHNGVIMKKNFSIGKINSSINHYPFRNFNEHMNRIRKYAIIQAQTNPEYNSFPGKYFGIFYRPIAYFFYNYIYREGFLDGKHGFVWSCLSMYHEILTFKYVWFNNCCKNNSYDRCSDRR
jgi:glycosyltransferase involved in cell wall biosynthesis